MKLKINILLKSEKGITLVEIMIYLVIFAIVSITVTMFAWDVINNKVKVTAYQEVQQNTRFAMDYLIQNIKSAEKLVEEDENGDDYVMPRENIAFPWIEDACNTDKNYCPNGGNSRLSYKKGLLIKGMSGAGKNYAVPFIFKLKAAQNGCLDNIACVDASSEYFPYDLVITDSDGTTILDYWVEKIWKSASAWDNAKIWVKIPYDLSYDRIIYIYYYDRPFTGPVPDISGQYEESERLLINSYGEKVFTFFDDFPKNSTAQDFFTNYGTKWGKYYTSSSGLKVSDGSLSNDEGNLSSTLYPKIDKEKTGQEQSTLNRPIALRMKSRINKPDSHFEKLFFLLFENTSNAYYNYLFAYPDSGTNKISRIKKYYNGWEQDKQSPVWWWSVNTDYIFDIMASTTSYALKSEQTTDPFTNLMTLSFQDSNPNQQYNTGINVLGLNSGNAIQIDWFLARKYIWPEPRVISSFPDTTQGYVYGEDYPPKEEDLQKLALQMFKIGNNIVRFRVYSGTLQMDKNDNIWQDITSKNMEITNLTFFDLSYPDRIETNPRSKSLRIELTMKHRNPNKIAAFQAQVHLEESVTLGGF